MNTDEIYTLRLAHQPNSTGLTCVECVKLIPQTRSVAGTGLAMPSLYPCTIVKLLDALEEATVND
jgi:hypothetical protein